MNRLLVVALLSLIPAVPLLAQDAAAPIRRSPAPEPTPTAAASPAEAEPETEASPTPSPTPTPTLTAPPEPSPTEEPAASPEEPAATPASEQETRRAEAATQAASPAPTARSGRRVIKEQPVRAVEPRSDWSRRRSTPAPTPAAGTPRRPTFDVADFRGSSVAGQVKALERRWQRALLDRDISVINELVAEDFVGTSSTGRTGTKSTLLYEFRRDKNTYKTADVRGMSVRSPSDDTAIVTGIATETGVSRDGKRFRVSRRFTDTWVERNGRWQCVASHTTALPN